MSLKQFNESFKKLYEGIDVEKENMLESDVPVLDQLRSQLSRVSNDLRQSGNYNIKAYEIAFQDVIERLFPDNAWWEVIDIDIFTDLFNERNPEATIDRIIDSVKPKFRPQITEESLEETLEEDDLFDLNSDIYNAISKVLSKGKWKNSPISAEDIESAIEFFLNHYTDDDLITLRECLDHLNEAEMSDEDKRDSDLIRSMLGKMANRSNARFSPEEIAVMNKYGIQRDNHTRNLTVAGRDLARDIDKQSTAYRYSRNRNNGTPSKINYADRARKLPQRKETQIFTQPWTIDNDQLNAHGYNHSNLDGLQDAERYSLDIPTRDKMTSMKNALSDRKYYQKQIDGADAEREAALTKAKAEYDKKVADAEKWHEYHTVDAARSRDYHQKKIDTLLKRKPVEESIGGKWTEKAFSIINDLDNTTELKDMLKKLLKDMSDKDVGEFLHQRGYIEYKD